MNCDEIRRGLPDHLKGTPLSPAAQDHLRGCPACRRELEDLQGLWTALGQLELPEGLPFRQAGTPRRRWPGLLPAAAAGLLLVAGGMAVDRAWLACGTRPLGRNDGPLAMVRSSSAAERAKGIALLGQGEGDLTATLLDLVEQDPDTHVRLAAVDSLYLSAGAPDLRQRVGEALLKVDRPEVQIALVDLLVGLRERQAVEALKGLVAQGRLTPEVRGRVVSGIRQLETQPI